MENKKVRKHSLCEKNADEIGHGSSWIKYISEKAYIIHSTQYLSALDVY